MSSENQNLIFIKNNIKNYWEYLKKYTYINIKLTYIFIKFTYIL